MKTLLLSLCFILCQSISFAQNANVFVTDIREERELNQKNSVLQLHIKVNGIAVNENKKIKIGSLLKANDNTGNELKQVLGSFDNEYSDANEVVLKLQAPMRNATQLSVVEGTLKYFTPTKSNKGITEIAQPLDKYNTNLLKNLKAGISLILIDEQGLKKLKAENETAYNKAVEKLKKENPDADKMVELVGGFKGFFESLFSYGSYGPTLTFLVDDPSKKIVQINVYNEKGEKMNNGWSSGDRQLTIMLSAPLQNSWKIEILLENNQSLKELKFKLAQVYLP